MAGAGAWVGTKLSAWETQQKIELDQMLEKMGRPDTTRAKMGANKSE